MAAKKSKSRTIGFYELMKIEGVETKRFKHSDWSKIFEELKDQPLKARVHRGEERTLIGDFIEVDGELHLKLMRVRDESAWLELYDASADTVSDLALKDKNALLETSIVCFLPFGNVIGVVQGSIESPSASAVAEWINGLAFLKDVRVAAEVMMSTQALKKLAKSPEASRLEATVHTSKAAALEASGAKLGKSLRTISEEYGDMKVTVIFQASRAKGKAREATRAALRKEAKALEELDGGVDKLKANLVYYDVDDQVSTEEVDFFRGRITAKRDIATTSEDGSPIRNESAVTAILLAAKEHEAELKGIVGN